MYVFHDDTLSPSGKLVYGRLRLYGGSDGMCYPKHETLARECCLSTRRLREVLTELRGAGLIDWTRTRSSCVFTFPERLETANLGGGIAPPRAAKNGRSRLAENRLQKRSIENHHQKRGFEKKMERASAEAETTTIPAAPRTPLPNSLNVDDEKNQRGAELALHRKRLSDPRAEFVARLKERHGDSVDAERTADLVRIELGNSNLSLSDDFLDFEARTTTRPAGLYNPVGHYCRLPKKFLNERRVTLIEQEMTLRAPLQVVESTGGRCEQCRGGGRMSYPDGDYCLCSVGIDLQRADARLQTEREAVVPGNSTEAP